MVLTRVRSSHPARLTRTLSMVLNVLTAASSRQPRTNSCSRIDLHALGASDEHSKMNKERGAWLQTRRRCQRGASGSEAGRAERSGMKPTLRAAPAAVDACGSTHCEQDVRHRVHSDTSRHGSGGIRGGWWGGEPRVSPAAPL